jgi:hypothetical protein
MTGLDLSEDQTSILYLVPRDYSESSGPKISRYFPLWLGAGET